MLTTISFGKTYELNPRTSLSDSIQLKAQATEIIDKNMGLPVSLIKNLKTDAYFFADDAENSSDLAKAVEDEIRFLELDVSHQANDTAPREFKYTDNDNQILDVQNIFYLNQGYQITNINDESLMDTSGLGYLAVENKEELWAQSLVRLFKRANAWEVLTETIGFVQKPWWNLHNFKEN